MGKHLVFRCFLALAGAASMPVCAGSVTAQAAAPSASQAASAAEAQPPTNFTVPEPETLALMVAGLLGVGFMAGRRRDD